MTPRARAGRQGGFTLIELMVALVVSSLLIGLILSIFTRMSTAYRAQQNVAELQQTLAAAQELIQRDLRQTGYQLPDGFKWAGAPDDIQQALKVTNNADGFGPDQLGVFHADASAQARVDAVPAVGDPFTAVSVDDRDLFAAGDLAVVVVTFRDDPVIRLPNGAAWTHYVACVVRITDIAGDVFTLETAAPWGNATNSQCGDVRDRMAAPATAMLYRFSARAYRVDPARRALAVLQMSPSGGLVADDWQDLGVGFTDLQVATRWNDLWDGLADGVDASAIDADADGDFANDWWSSEGQEAMTIAIPAGAPRHERSVPSTIRVSLVVRTIKQIDAVPTAATPTLTVAANVNNNDLGDRPAVALAGVADAMRPVELRGDAVFRHATIGADLRNMAVGQ